MVDWTRVEELRSKGWDWDRIAADPKVGFRADTAAGNPGRALRALYHRSRASERAKAGESPAGAAGSSEKRGGEARWNLLRVFYLLVPLVGVWFAFAYFIPSPIGLVVPAIPYLGLVLAALAAVLLWILWRATSGPRWSKTYRNALVGGVVLGFVVAGLIGITGTAVFGCPFLPSSSRLSDVPGSGWTIPAQKLGVSYWQNVPTSAWQSGGLPVFYSYGTTWCPYCSASSWAEWKALTSFGNVTGISLDYSSSSDVYPRTPEVVLAGIALNPKAGHAPPIAVQINEDTSGNRANFPATANCVQQAYVTAYASGIPFVAINGVYVHDGALDLPQNLSAWANGANGGAGAVKASVASETPASSGGNPWAAVQFEAWWLMALMTKASGQDVTTLANEFGWSAADKTAVSHDLTLLG